MREALEALAEAAVGEAARTPTHRAGAVASYLLTSHPDLVDAWMEEERGRIVTWISEVILRSNTRRIAALRLVNGTDTPLPTWLRESIAIDGDDNRKWKFAVHYNDVPNIIRFYHQRAAENTVIALAWTDLYQEWPPGTTLLEAFTIERIEAVLERRGITKL